MVHGDHSHCPRLVADNSQCRVWPASFRIRIPINKENEMFMLGLFLAGLAIGYNGLKSPMFYVGAAGIILINVAQMAPK